jgi:hypothetical protein
MLRGLNPTASPPNFSAYDFKGKLGRFEFCAASTTIAIDQPIFFKSQATALQ